MPRLKRIRIPPVLKRKVILLDDVWRMRRKPKIGDSVVIYNKNKETSVEHLGVMSSPKAFLVTHSGVGMLIEDYEKRKKPRTVSIEKIQEKNLTIAKVGITKRKRDRK